MGNVGVQKPWLSVAVGLDRVLEGGSLKKSLMMTSPDSLFPAIKKRSQNDRRKREAR